MHANNYSIFQPFVGNRRKLIYEKKSLKPILKTRPQTEWAKTRFFRSDLMPEFTTGGQTSSPENARFCKFDNFSQLSTPKHFLRKAGLFDAGARN